MKHIAYYFRSQYDASWWIVFTIDKPNHFYGMQPPKRSKFPVIYYYKHHLRHTYAKATA